MSVTRVFATSMNCGSCLAKLKPVLDGSPAVIAWTADLEDERKLVSFEVGDSVEASELVDLIAQAGFEAVEVEPAPVESSSAKPLSSSNRSSTFKLSTYRPLFLVVSYVVGAATLFELAQSSFDLMRWMSSFMGFFFLGFAFFKLLDIGKFADAFASYDVIAKHSRAYGLAYPWIEVALGLLFVTQTWLPVANGLTAVVMAVGLIGVIRAVSRREVIQCACLGTGFNLPMSAVTIVENSVMLLMAIVMLIR